MAELGESAWLVGERLTLADIVTFNSLLIPYTLSLDGGFRKAMPAAALNFQFGGMVAGQYDSIDSIARYVYAEEVQTFQALDATYGRIITDCL